MRRVGRLIASIIVPRHFVSKMQKQDKLDLFFLLLYVLVVGVVEYLAKSQEGMRLAILSIGFVFLCAVSYWLIIRISGGYSTYVQALNYLLPIETMAELSHLLIGVFNIGKPFVLVVNLYCFYLKVYGALKVNRISKKKLGIVYICYTACLLLGADIIFLIISGIAISDWGYLG